MKKGDTVWFEDPDGGLSSGCYNISRVCGDIYRLSNSRSNVEAYQEELSACNPPKTHKKEETMKSIKNKTIQGYNVKRLASFIDRAMLRDETPKWRVDSANGKIYKFDRVHGGFLFYVTIADHNIDTLRDIAHGVNLGLIVKESIALEKAKRLESL